MSVTALWLCLRGLEVSLLPGVVGSGCGVDEDVVGALGAVFLPCSPAHEKTDENESFLCGWRRPSGLCFESLASLDMALPGSEGKKKKRKRDFK